MEARGEASTRRVDGSIVPASLGRVEANDGGTGTLGIGLNTGLIYDRLLWVFSRSW
jgi:hypothetical protein